jgi:alpha-galactosidase
LSRWINGETGGYLRVCTEGRNWFETDFPHWLKEEPPVIAPDKRSEEHGSYILEALETGRVYRGHFNVINQHHIPNLPDGCVIEIPGYVDRTGINMPVVGDLPLACAATCAASVHVQEMGMEAAVHGNITLLKQAMLHDPLVGAVCNPEESSVHGLHPKGAMHTVPRCACPCPGTPREWHDCARRLAPLTPRALLLLDKPVASAQTLLVRSGE